MTAVLPVTWADRPVGTACGELSCPSCRCLLALGWNDDVEAAHALGHELVCGLCGTVRPVGPTPTVPRQRAAA